MCSVEKSKRVWIWTENQQVMTAAVKRGCNTFVFLSQNHQLAKDWSKGEVFDCVEKRVASICEDATRQELKKLQPLDEQADNIVIDLLDWQGPVHAYILVPGEKTCYLSELKSGKEMTLVDQKGQQRTAIDGRVNIVSRPLILVEAKGSDHQTHYSVILQNAETVALIAPFQENEVKKNSCIRYLIEGGG